MESGAVVKKRKQYVTKNSEKDYSVYTLQKEKGRVITKSVCTIPALNDKQARLKGQNFCTMVGYDFSHTKMMRQT
jgi:hypothetical protein